MLLESIEQPETGYAATEHDDIRVQIVRISEIIMVGFCADNLLLELKIWIRQPL